ncbi:uncharacterized protein F4812DRAFT_70110 [Daldinia caldariorum]|uniref:uncharacterized protein n=1 Tax=Daldinia caldariorum TaxID=326644 RepID=UPI0020087D8F|nr:uncharacterized protein F4812DRAFT_70110 [Daldinia caldariorum]KAI1466892.1 hypothetical protein F4812DRAFT_70110 [Daldinia caldariorum]
MAEYAAAAISAITASAAIVSSSTAHRQQIYRGYNAIENPPWQRRPPFTSMSPRRFNAYYGCEYGQPLYYPSGLHEHLVHHTECPASQCHYQAFLIDSIQRYNASRLALRETYVWNLRELARVHASQPRKPDAEKHAEAERLYAYYVSRVRDVFEEHRYDHRRLLGQDYLYWTQPDREHDHVRRLLLLPFRAVSRSRSRSRIASLVEEHPSDDAGARNSGGTCDALGTAGTSNTTAAAIQEVREENEEEENSECTEISVESNTKEKRRVA